MRTIKKNSKRWLAMVLSLVMCLGLLQVPAMAAEEEGSTLVKSAFQYAQNLDQGDTCTGIVVLDGDPITDSGTPNVWTTGMWGGAQDVTGYNWVHITNTNPDVATVTYTTDGGKLSITFTPGTVKGRTSVSVGVDARYPHDQLGTYNMELNFDYTVTNENGDPNVPETPTAATITNAAQVQVVCLDTPQHIATYTLKANPGGWTASAPEPTDSSDEPFTSAGIEWRSVLTLNNEYWVEKFNATSSGHVLDAQATGVVTIKTYWYNGQWTFNTQESTVAVYVKEAPTPSYTYSLTYNGNGGTVNGQASYTATSGSTTATSYSFSELTAVRDGYQFKGWASTQSKADAGTVDITWPVTLTSTDASKTVYAVWEANAPAHSVTRGDDGSMILVKRFTGADMPESFFMYYEVTNAATSEIYNSDILTFTKVSTGFYRANVSYPTWEFTGEWTMEEKQAYNSIIKFAEYGTEVEGKVLTINAAGAVVDQNEQTITYTVDAQSKNVGMKTVINAYSVPVVSNKQLTGFTKTRLTEVPAGLGLTGINTADPVELKVGQSATLLYAITVSGTEGANYKVSDDATWVGGAAEESAIDASGSATIYVTKTFTIDNIEDGFVKNIAYIEAGADTDLGNTEPSASSNVSATGQLVGTKAKTPKPDRTVDFSVEVTNKIGSTLSKVELTDVMTNLTMKKNADGEPDYTVKLYSADGVEIAPTVSFSLENDGRKAIWTFTGSIEPNAKIVVTYSGVIDGDETEVVDWKNSVIPGYQTAQNLAARVNLSDGLYTESDWMYSDEFGCEGRIGQ